MEKLTRFIEEKIAPPLIKFSQMRYVQIIQRTFITFTGLLIVGSLFLLLASFPVQGYKDFIGTFSAKFAAASGVGTSFIGLFVVISAAFATIEYYNKNGENNDILGPVILSVACFFLIVPAQTVKTFIEGKDPGTFAGVPTDFLGPKGVFAALIIAIVTAELYRFFVRKKLVIKMPEGVPPMVAQAFVALIPSLLIVTFWWVIRVVLNINLPQIIMNAFQPLVSAGDSVATVMTSSFLNRILWSVGIHGGNVVGSVASPIWTQINVANQAAMAAGESLPHLFSGVFYDNYIWIGLAPLSAIMCFSKSKRIKALGVLSLPAALFNIGEPLIFGLPIVMNPLMMIPFVLSYMVIAVVAVVLVSTGILPVPVLTVPWITPAPIKAFLSTNGSFAAALFVIATWVILAVVFWPFVKAMEKNDLKDELLPIDGK
ncbi:MAG: PTS transporter subunit EIIC [Clostridium sp.]|uniref:PTS sugar transporter subunit IIC n=1 Tax=Clostridium sp. TaxID=1506 RepID=UPI002915AA26|nr:PTS transporter subunit EIIC [Clostridium sp.]MDU6874749.1 PTS transporter subunit EIIC [Clostridium sp.]MDU6935810.1 PTS transporter subunit EIIC [Clostridium sp.]